MNENVKVGKNTMTGDAVVWANLGNGEADTFGVKEITTLAWDIVQFAKTFDMEIYGEVELGVDSERNIWLYAFIRGSYEHVPNEFVQNYILTANITQAVALVAFNVYRCHHSSYRAL